MSRFKTMKFDLNTKERSDVEPKNMIDTNEPIKIEFDEAEEAINGLQVYVVDRCIAIMKDFVGKDVQIPTNKQLIDSLNQFHRLDINFTDFSNNISASQDALLELARQYAIDKGYQKFSIHILVTLNNEFNCLVVTAMDRFESGAENDAYSMAEYPFIKEAYQVVEDDVTIPENNQSAEVITENKEETDLE